LEVVASVCSSIARFILSTEVYTNMDLKTTETEVVLIPPPNKLGGLLSTRL
jgi:hypothetical protein